MRMKTVVPLPQMSETEICNTVCEKSGKIVPYPKKDKNQFSFLFPSLCMDFKAFKSMFLWFFFLLFLDFIPLWLTNIKAATINSKYTKDIETRELERSTYYTIVYLGENKNADQTKIIWAKSFSVSLLSLN